MDSTSGTEPQSDAVTVRALDDMPRVQMAGGVGWIPVRSELGYLAHGVNAWIGDEVGAELIERHTESETTQHQELYVVLRGRAKFTVDGAEHVAEAGTLVFVPSWSSERVATAEEAGTIVLSLGGPPTFDPSAWEWSHRALQLVDTDPARAREIFEDGLDTLPENGAMYYNYACMEARLGESGRALDLLDGALELRPDLREHARDDEHLASLRELPRFQRVTGQA